MKEAIESFELNRVTPVEDFENLEEAIERAKEVQAQIDEINESMVVRGPAEYLRAESLAELYTKLLRSIPSEVRREHGLPDPGRYPERSEIPLGDWASI